MWMSVFFPVEEGRTLSKAKNGISTQIVEEKLDHTTFQSHFKCANSCIMDLMVVATCHNCNNFSREKKKKKYGKIEFLDPERAKFGVLVLFEAIVPSKISIEFTYSICYQSYT